jgi:hypothetical protein
MVILPAFVGRDQIADEVLAIKQLASCFIVEYVDRILEGEIEEEFIVLGYVHSRGDDGGDQISVGDVHVSSSVECEASMRPPRSPVNGNFSHSRRGRSATDRRGRSATDRQGRSARPIPLERSRTLQDARTPITCYPSSSLRL